MTETSIARRASRATIVLALCSIAAQVQGAKTRAFSVKFRPMVGAETFACGKSYAGVGLSKATITPSDFGLYVYDVTLLAASGAEAPLTLDQDGVYQNGSLALLDFEDGTGPCSNGNASTHMDIKGTACRRVSERAHGFVVPAQSAAGEPVEGRRATAMTLTAAARSEAALLSNCMATARPYAVDSCLPRRASP
jgi:hypothetical protein